MSSRTIALVGATPTAELIASRALHANLHVIIDDISDSRLQAISTNLQAVVRAQRSCAPGPQDQSDSAGFGFSYLSLTQSIESAIRSADVLIDTLPDDLEVKLELFTLFDKFAKPNAIFITTSAIPIDDLAGITFCPDRCIAVRLANSPNQSPSFELLPGVQTSPQTLATSHELFAKLHEIPSNRIESIPKTALD